MNRIDIQRKVRGFATAAALGVATLSAGSATAVAADSVQPLQQEYVSVIARHSFKCLTIERAGTADGARARQGACLGGVDPSQNQLWHLDPYNGQYRLKAAHSGKCLTIADSSQSDRAKAVQRPCGSGYNQQFAIQPTDSGYNTMIARHSGKCLDVYGDSTANGVPVWQFTCDNGYNQQWAFE